MGVFSYDTEPDFRGSMTASVVGFHDFLRSISPFEDTILAKNI